MRRVLVFASVLPLLVFAAAGCGGSDEEVRTPVACLTRPDSWLIALADAPQEVRLGGTTPISECLPAEQPAGPQAQVGKTAVDTATALSAGMRKGYAKAAAAKGDPFGKAAATQAGYLVGALARGAEGSQGINATLLDRVESAATNFLGAGQELQGAYQRGYEAGLESG